MSYMILVTCFASCHTNIIDEGMEGFVEQTTTFGAPSSEEAVDLGLSVKWASYNVGASNPTEYGNYYAWGEIEPKTNYSSETYTGPADFFGSVDTYGTEYDVAYVKWGHEWRIPTMDELIEIQEKCKWEATEQDGVKGMKVTGPNGNSIFFPAAGRCVGNRFEDVGVIGHYWQGCANGDGSQTGEYTYYDLNAITNGLTIRPVLESYQVYEIDPQSLDGWDFGYTLNDEYIVGYIDEDGTIVTMINKNGGTEEQGLIICLNENGIITSVGGIENIYNVDYTENNIILHRINNEGLYEEEILPLLYSEQYKAMTRAGGIDFNIIQKGIDFIGNIQNANSIGSDLKNWDWWQLLKDGLLTAGEFAIGKLNPTAGTLITVGKWPIDYYRNQNYERQRNALYNQCDIQINEIRNESGCCTVYATVKNANTLYNYLVNMYEPIENESTRNLVYCGIVVRANNEYVTTHLNDYHTQEILLNGDVNYGNDANFSFSIPDVILNKSHTTFYFRPYLKSTRIKSSKGVDEGYIKYGNTVPYECFTGEIIEFNQYNAEFSTDENNNGFVMFNTTVHASIESVKGIEEWGVYVYNLNNSGVYDYYPSEFKASKLEDFIDIDFNINKDEFDELNYGEYFASKNIEIGVYKKTENPTGMYDYLSYFYSEPETHELIYNQKPSLTFTSANVNGTEIIDQDEEEGYVRYSTSFNIAYKVNGSFWFDNLNFGIPSDVNDNVGLVEVRNGDGSYDGSYFWEYSNTSSTQLFLYLIGNLTAGGTFVSDNMLMFSGMPITGVSVSGNSGRAMQQTRDVNGEKKHSSLNK